MKPGMEIHGPGIIESTVTTIVVNPKDTAVMDEFQNVRLLVESF
jgi:N-methylhydantoinase A/oxoprolinase/acetone carboxylase beta subunit